MSTRNESGQVLPLVAVMMLGLMVLAGLVVDAGVVFATRRDLQATADAAARAGAASIDVDAYRSSGGRRSVLDPADAERAALDRLQAADVQVVVVSEHAVRVELTRTQPLLVLGLVGVGPVEVQATSTAQPRTGILAPGG